MQGSRQNVAIWMAAVAAAGLIGAASPAQPATKAAQEKPPVARGDGSREFRNADELLTALEQADDGMKSLTAQVRYDRTQEIVGDHQVNYGRLYFVTGLGDDGKVAEGGRKFAIVFTQRIVDGIAREEQSTYIFDGEWLVEKNYEERLFIKRQVVPPGERFDPLRIGEGPMPLPIGQRREDILERYTAELLEPTDGLDADPAMHPDELAQLDDVRQFVSQAYQIRLEPRPHQADEDEFEEVRLWYSRGRDGHLLPRMARTVSRTGDISLVRLVDVQVQMAGAEVNPHAEVPMDVLDTTQPRRGWHVQVTDWRGRTPGQNRGQ